MASGMQKKIVWLGVMTALWFALMDTAVHATMVKLENVPDYQWTNGCSPTAATMMMAYYAINSYGGHSYSNLIPGGTPPLNTFNNPNALVTSAIDTMAHDMGTTGGATTFHYYANGGKFTPQDALANGLQGHDGTYGLYQYVKNAGYNADAFTEQISNTSTDPNKFTFTDFETGINEGRPVLLSMFGTAGGHTVLGYGYDDSTMSIYIRDTWATGGYFGGGIMQWGGTYDGMSLYIATDLTPSSSPVPEPATMLLFGTGIAGLAGMRRRKEGRSTGNLVCSLYCLFSFDHIGR
jgi:hypothetical protein